MQVSWIEPEELRALANDLLDPQPKNVTSTWDLRTLPDAPTGDASALENVEEKPQYLEESFASQDNQPSAEVAQIREKLRIIRDRAQLAGLLPTSTPAPEKETLKTFPSANVSSPFRPAPQEFPAEPESSEEEDLPVEEIKSEDAALASKSAPNVAETVVAENVPSGTTFLPLEGTISERLDAFAQWAIKLTACEELVLVDDHGDILWGVPKRNDLIASTMLALNSRWRSSAKDLSDSSLLFHSQLTANRQLNVLPCRTRYGAVTLAVVSENRMAQDTAKDLNEALILAVDGAQFP